jgi:hypothetical protein
MSKIDSCKNTKSETQSAECGMYHNMSEKGGRPNCDVILMFKILILQQLTK